MANRLFAVLFALFISVFGVPAFAVGPDFSTLTSAVDYGTATAAILLVMAGLAGVYIVMSGGSMILSKLKGGR